MVKACAIFEPIIASVGNSADPVQTPHKAASDQGLHYLQKMGI